MSLATEIGTPEAAANLAGRCDEKIEYVPSSNRPLTIYDQRGFF